MPAVGRVARAGKRHQIGSKAPTKRRSRARRATGRCRSRPCLCPAPHRLVEVSLERDPGTAGSALANAEPGTPRRRRELPSGELERLAHHAFDLGPLGIGWSPQRDKAERAMARGPPHSLSVRHQAHVDRRRPVEMSVEKRDQDALQKRILRRERVGGHRRVFAARLDHLRANASSNLSRLSRDQDHNGAGERPGRSGQGEARPQVSVADY